MRLINRNFAVFQAPNSNSIVSKEVVAEFWHKDDADSFAKAQSIKQHPSVYSVAQISGNEIWYSNGYKTVY